MGKFLALVNYQANLTAVCCSQHPLVVDLVAKATNSEISLSWSTWAIAMLLPGLVALIVMPLIMYWMYPLK
jgi:DASS family divalent anion:Na+ symporter